MCTPRDEFPGKQARTSRVRPCVVRTLVSLLALTCVPASATEPPYRLDPPAFLGAPQESKSLFGSTYAYLAADGSGHVRLLVTLMRVDEVRARFPEMTDTRCVNLFLEELRAEHEGFFVVAMSRPMKVGPAELPRFRWTGERGRRTMAGVLACGQLDGHYYVVHFSDELRAATRTFPRIRASLRALEPRHE